MNDMRPRLIVARVSGDSDSDLLGMASQTFDLVPEATPRLRASAAEVLADPDSWGARRMRRGGSTAFLYMEPETKSLVLLSEGSAAAADVSCGKLDETNGFVELLREVLAQHRPTELVLAQISRLVRDDVWAGQLRRSLEKHCHILVTQLGRLDLSLESGRSSFMFQASFSAMDARAINARLDRGRVNKHVRGQWAHGRHQVPLAWRLEPSSGGDRIVLDEAMVPVVAQLIDLLADPALNLTTVVAAMGELGLTSPLQGGWGLRSDGGPTVATLDDPRSRAQRWVRDLPLYRGVPHELLLPVVVEGDSVHGLPLEKDEKNRRCVRLVTRLPLPEAGTWPVDRVRQAEDVRRPQSSGGRPLMMPLVDGRGGRSWHDADAGQQRRLTVVAGRYVIQGVDDELAASARSGDPVARRAQTREAGPGGWHGWTRRGAVKGVQQLALMDPVALHRSLADGLSAAVAAGVELGRIDLPELRAPALRLLEKRAPSMLSHRAQVTEKVAALDRDLTTLSAVAANLSSKEAVQSLAARMDRVGAELAANRQVLSDLERSQPVRPPTVFRSPAAAVVGALAALGRARGPVPREVCIALSDVLVDLRFHPQSSTVGWSVRLLLPSDDGHWWLTEPVLGEVDNRLPARNTMTAQTAELLTPEARDDRLLVAYVAEGVPPVALASRQGRQGRTWLLKRAFADRLTAVGVDRVVTRRLLECPIPVTRRIAWEAVLADLDRRKVAHPWRKEVPTSGLPPGFRTVVEAAVLGGVRHKPYWWVEAPFARALVATLASGPAAIEVLAERLGVTRQHLKRAVAEMHLPVSADRVVALPCCPDCRDSVDLLLWLPEVPERLICRKCRVTPTGTTYYPEIYADLSQAWVDAYFCKHEPDRRSSRTKPGAGPVGRAADVE